MEEQLRKEQIDELNTEKRIEVCELPVSSLNHKFPNPRKPLTAKRKAALEESLEKLGDFGVIVIDENLSIISGNRRCEILHSINPDTVVLCKKLIGYSDAEKKAINIKANTHAGEFDMHMLADWVSDMKLDLSTDFLSLKQPENKIPEMELIRFEKYDYVMIVCRNEVDYNNLVRALGIEDKKIVINKGKNADRKIKCRAIWYDSMKAQITPKKD